MDDDEIQNDDKLVAGGGRKRASVVEGASLSDLLKSNDVSNKITIDNTRDAVLIADNEFKMFLKEISNIDDNDDLLDMIETKKNSYLFTSNHLMDILSLVTSVKTRLQIIIKIGPRLTNPTAKHDELLNMFRFAEDKNKVEEILKARVKQTGASSVPMKNILGNKGGSALAMGKGGSALALGRSGKVTSSNVKTSTPFPKEPELVPPPPHPEVILDDFAKDPEEEKKVKEELALMASALRLSTEDINDIKGYPLEKWEIKAIVDGEIEKTLPTENNGNENSNNNSSNNVHVHDEPKRRFSAWLQQKERKNNDEDITIEVSDDWREDVRRGSLTSLFKSIEILSNDKDNDIVEKSSSAESTTIVTKKRRSTYLAPLPDISNLDENTPAFLSLPHEDSIGTSSTGRPYFTYQELVRRNYHKNYFDLNPKELELYLCNEEFMSKFGMTKDQFKELPKWRQTAKKRTMLLF